MIPAFRKELVDLRQRDIERSSAIRIGRAARRRFGAGIRAAVATSLHRVADRLEPAADLPVEARSVAVRHS